MPDLLGLSGTKLAIWGVGLEIAGSSQRPRPQAAAAARFRGRSDHETLSFGPTQERLRNLGNIPGIFIGRNFGFVTRKSIFVPASFAEVQLCCCCENPKPCAEAAVERPVKFLVKVCCSSSLGR